MVKHTATAAAWLGCFFSASAQSEIPSIKPSSALPEFDAVRAVFSHGEMDFDDGPGSLKISNFEFRTLLSKPITPIDGLTLLPVFDYKATVLDFDNVPGAYPINDEGLHSLSLSMFALKTQQGSPWIYGGWARAEMATDFQHINSDDFTFDVAAGVGYQFNDCFLLGVGAALANINGDATFYPGIFFDWMINEQFRVGLYGPLFVAAYTPDENWVFSVRGDSGGGIWNITDDAGDSRSIDLTTYRLGLYASRRLSGQFWVRAGVGATFGNDIRLTEPNGDRLFKQELDGGMFGEVSLRLASW